MPTLAPAETNVFDEIAAARLAWPLPQSSVGEIGRASATVGSVGPPGGGGGGGEGGGGLLPPPPPPPQAAMSSASAAAGRTLKRRGIMGSVCQTGRGPLIRPGVWSKLRPFIQGESRMSEHKPIDPRVVALYDEYCHGRIDRREFLARAQALVIGGVTALSMAQLMFPRYADAQTISFTDERIRANYVDYDSPGGTSGRMRGYLVRPTTEPPFPAVLVIHENRGLNPHIEDVARRAATEGFLALAPDGLAPVGGYPGNDDDGRQLQGSLDREKLSQDMINSARWLKSHELSSGKLGATGFCWGGGMTGALAVELGADLSAGVPFYGAAPAPADAARVKAPLLVQLAENDERINSGWPASQAALEAAGVSVTVHTYPGTNHGFHNNSTPRFDEAAAALAWERTVAFFREHLA